MEYKNSMEEALGEVNWSDRKSLIGTAAASFEKLTEEKTVAQESEDADAGDNNSVYVKID